MAELSYIDGSLIAGQTPGINDRYPTIINYDIVKPPFQNNSFNTRFTQTTGEESDSNTVFFQKRLGFNKIKIYEYDAQEANYSEIVIDERNFTDVAFLDGIRYMFAVSKDFKQMKIFKQIYVNDNNSCSNNSDEGVDLGYFVNIVKYQYYDTNTSSTVTLRYFPFNECLCDKFVITDRVKGKSKDSGTNGHARNELVGLNVNTYFYDTAKSIAAGSTDYLLIYDGDLASQVNLISLNGVATGAITNAALMQSAFVGFSNVKNSLQTTSILGGVTSVTITNTSNQTVEDSSVQKWKVFQEYGDVLTFATSDGIFWLHFSDPTGRPSLSEFTYDGNTFFNTTNNANKSPFIISSMASSNAAFQFFNSKDGRLFCGLQGYQKFYTTLGNSYVFGRDYTDLEKIGGYIAMLGSNRVTLINPTIAGDIVSFTQYLNLHENFGYFNRGSRTVDSGVLWLFNSDKKIVKTALQTYGDTIVPKTDYQTVFYESDLSILRKGIDKVYLRTSSADLKIIISDGVDSKIILLNNKYNTWYKWMIDNVAIRDFKYNTWFGDEIYDRIGNKDKGEFYKTIIHFFNGGDAYLNTRMHYFIRFALGYNSIVTKNKTFIKFFIDEGGRHNEFVYDDLWRTDYIWNLAHLRMSGNISTVFKNIPIGITLRGGNGLGYVAPQIRNFQNEFTEWNSYNLTNDTDSNEKTTFTVAKFGLIEVPVNVVGETFGVEFITYGSDALEFGGLMLGYENMSMNQTRMEDVATVNDAQYGGMANLPLTHDSGTNNDIGV